MMSQHPYLGLKASIATMHLKETVMAPVLRRWLGVNLFRAENIDTDAMGTFTGEIPRIGTMLETARQKAKEAIRRTGAPLGVGSEGAFGPDPDIPFFASGSEIVLIYDARTDHEIYVHRRTRTNYDRIIVSPDQDPAIFLNRIGFPAHAIIIRPEICADSQVIIKGVQTPETVNEQIRSMADQSETGRAIIQTDMRAHLNPARMKSIGFVTKHLAVRARRLCPDCALPGFGPVDVVRGLPCAECATPTSRIKAVTYSCRGCSCKQNRHVRHIDYRADPAHCPQCNP